MMTPMDPGARAPDPHHVANYSESYTDAAYLARADPLSMLAVNDSMRTALRLYDDDCVRAALRGGATWEEIGRAAGMARQNAQRKWGHLR